MRRDQVISKMAESCVFAVVRVETVERGLEIAEGCYRGGVTAMEISYTNANAGDVIKAIREKYGDKMIVGAGTVLEAATAVDAIRNAGAQFVVAPNFEQEVATICNLYQVPYGPGCTTYSEMIQALKAGASFLKCFPISNYYGPNLAKVFKVPCPQFPILASGGVNFDNLADWMHNGAEWVGVGGLLTKGTTEEIAENAKKLHEIVVAVRNESGR
jgi:2-dehydro-3-deoxyphosphogluconate aldolase/(4S)-4-hydroxy-2-oxoglutarate aldolase